MDTALLVGSLALVVACIALMGLLALAREFGLMLVQLGPARPLITQSSGADIGAHIDLTVSTTFGEDITLGSTSSRKRLLLFMSPSCPICEDLKPDLKVMASSYKDELEVVVLSNAQDNQEDRAFANEFRPLGGLVASAPEAHTRFNILGTPFAMLISTEGEVLARGAVNNLQQLESMLGLEVRTNRVKMLSHGIPVYASREVETTNG